MDKTTERYIGLGIGLAVLFVALNAVNSVFSGTLSTSWSSALVTGAGFIAVAIIIIVYKLVMNAAGGSK